MSETHPMQTWRALGAGLVVVLVLSGCGTTVQGTVDIPASAARTPSPPPPTPTPTPPEVTIFHPGPPPVALRTQEGEATVTVRRYAWRHTENGPDASPPAHGYLVLDILVQATSGRVQVNPLYFTLRTPDGGELTSALGIDGNEPVLASRDLSAPQEVDGLVTFDSPRTAVTLVIADELGNEIGDIHLPDSTP